MSGARPDDRSDNKTAWWKSPAAESLVEAEEQMERAYAQWEKVRHAAEKLTVREWQLLPESPVFQPYRIFIAALNEEVNKLPEVCDAWDNFVEAVRRQQRALSSWLEETYDDISMLEFSLQSGSESSSEEESEPAYPDEDELPAYELPYDLPDDESSSRESRQDR
ncbi:MAG: hypothetical protein M3347_12365 [Armatimonadota bacterium]|nr:hypothetical protein [Armatimonadota bacterium]